MLTAVGDVMRRAYEKGWITTRDGNISLRRRNSDVLYITPSGWRKTIIHPERIIRMKISGEGALTVPDGQTPTGLRVKRDLTARDTQITVLPDDIIVGGDVYGFKGDPANVPAGIKLFTLY